jgi:hypothetical protein
VGGRSKSSGDCNPIGMSLTNVPVDRLIPTHVSNGANPRNIQVQLPGNPLVGRKSRLDVPVPSGMLEGRFGRRDDWADECTPPQGH